MALYLRLIAADEGPGQAELERVLAELELVQARPLEPHPKGGFRVFLDVDRADGEGVAQALHARGWLPCY
ncbi:MAG: hypothetical protein R3F62_24530 [Planctomycetota bacterium]